MTRTDIHLDAMLRHLGAAYYDSLHGRAARPDVIRALEAVEEQVKAQQRQAPGGPRPPSEYAGCGKTVVSRPRSGMSPGSGT